MFCSKEKETSLFFIHLKGETKVIPVSSGRKGEERGGKGDKKCEAKENSRRPFMQIMSI